MALSDDGIKRDKEVSAAVYMEVGEGTWKRRRPAFIFRNGIADSALGDVGIGEMGRVESEPTPSA